MNTLAEVIDAAPPTPACFPDALQWGSYLLACQQDSKQKPFRAGVYRPDFDHCRDCTLLHATLMARENKCNPSQFRVKPLIKETSHECL